MENEPLYTVKEVAERLKLNPETVRVWIRQGTLRAVLMGGRRGGYRVPAAELRRLLEGDRGKAAA
jgi:excisionase family DNA binding protein